MVYLFIFKYNGKLSNQIKHYLFINLFFIISNLKFLKNFLNFQKLNKIV